VSLAIYDATGALVRTLVAGASDPDDHVIVWDGRDAAGAAGSRAERVDMVAIR
jgi:flagellar hook assembly protein FlgD